MNRSFTPLALVADHHRQLSVQAGTQLVFGWAEEGDADVMRHAAGSLVQIGTLGPLVMLYLQQRIRRGELNRKTARNSRYTLHGFAASYGHRPVGRLSSRDVQRWMEDLDGLAPGSRRHKFTVVRAFCRWLVQHGSVRRDPCVDLRAPKEPRRLPRALKTDVVARVLDACPDDRGRLIVLLMVQEGLRCVEVAGLQIGDLDMTDRVMRVVGKGGHERILPITSEVADALRAHLGTQGWDAGPVIQSRNDPGRPLTPGTISTLVGRWCRDAGVKQLPRDGISAHAFRHTAATDMLRGGAHVRDVQHGLGHKHLATTEIYLPYVVHGLEKAMGGRQYGTHVDLSAARSAAFGDAIDLIAEHGLDGLSEVG